MRNIFDQYGHPENRLTHAFVCTLNEDRKLLYAFIQQFISIPLSTKALKIVEQTLPNRSENEEGTDSLPDALIYDEKAGVAVVFENKLKASLTQKQLDRHLRNVRQCGFSKIIPITIALAVNESITSEWQQLCWKDIYQWLYGMRGQSLWARKLAEYMKITEQRLMEKEYLVSGSLTTFSGIPFGEEHPLTYLEAKQTLRLLCARLRTSSSIANKLPADITKPGRHSITKGSPLAVWDFIPFKGTGAFNNAPHLTVGFLEHNAQAMLTIPDKIASPYRGNIRAISMETFTDALRMVLDSYKKNFKSVEGAKPVIKILQRHYKTQKSPATIDGFTEFDLRALFHNNLAGGVKQCRGWLEIAYTLLQEQVRSGSANIQFQIGVNFYYDKCNALKSPDSEKLFISSWLSLKPFINVVI